MVGRGGEGTLRVVPAEGDFPIEEIRRKKLGLATSRSLGHVILSKYGVSSQPEFFTADLEDGDKLVLGMYTPHSLPLQTTQHTSHNMIAQQTSQILIHRTPQLTYKPH